MASILEADFTNSQSETESSNFAGTALILSLFFIYFRKSNVVLVCAIVFSILTFKRLALVFVLLAVAISLFAPRLVRARIPHKALTTLKVLTLALTFAWYWLLLPEQESLFVEIFGQAPAQATMGRSISIRYLLATDFQSYGFGSANETIMNVFGVPFEMDFIKISLELSPIVLVLFVWVFWDLAGASFRGFFIIGFYCLNMITSDSLTSNFSLTLAYIVLGLIDRSITSTDDVEEQLCGDLDNRKFIH